ncbi:MAG TPA: FprA family A-type flavoprotein [Paludibacteraceae bacterium]|nr:FprA family A-type flavoprotein [Paludibacteraceae bacterium]
MKLAENLYYVGVNDRHKTLFENMLPLPYGVSYNSYLLVDDKVALIDTVELPFAEEQLETIQQILKGRKVDYLIVNHMEPDHSSGIKALRMAYPNVQIVGNSKTLSMLEGYYGISDGLYEVKEGSELVLGSRTLRFYMTPMVHWPEVMMAYDVENHILFSADAFGCFGTLDGGVLDTQLELDIYWSEMYRYYANIVGKYGNPVQAAFKKFADLQLDMICSTHGPVWTEHLAKAFSLYDRMSRYEGEQGVVIVYGSMYGHTEEMAQAVARGAGEVCKNVLLYDVSKTDASIILGNIFRYKGLILGSPTYCNELFPPIKSLLDKLEIRGLKNRVFGAFGSYSWAGAAVKGFLSFSERMKWETPPTVEVKQAMKPADYNALVDLGRTIAQGL